MSIAIPSPRDSVNIRIKVQGGTLADKFLCETCSFGAIMGGPSMKQIQIRCSAMDGPSFPVPFRVVKCNRYNEVDSTNLRQMKNDAYYIHKTAHGGCRLVTRAQFDDYDFLQKLEEADAAKLLRDIRSGKKRTAPKPKRSANKK